MARPKQIQISLEDFRRTARAKAVTVAHLYGLAPRYLSLECLRGRVPGAAKRGGHWWVTPDGMEKMFTIAQRNK